MIDFEEKLKFIAIHNNDTIMSEIRIKDGELYVYDEKKWLLSMRNNTPAYDNWVKVPLDYKEIFMKVKIKQELLK